MAMNPETYEEFQRQLELQKEEECSIKEKGPKVKVDEDGTEYEWDESKKAWFPKLSVELMMKYQSNYATSEDQSDDHSTYTDPVTNIRYNWNTENSRWEPTSSSNNKSDPYRYTDAKGTTYLWNFENNKWEIDNQNTSENGSNCDTSTVQKDGEVASTSDQVEESDEKKSQHTYTDDNTGVKYTWNIGRHLWVSDDGQIMVPATNTHESYTNEKTGEKYLWNNEKQEWVLDKSAKTKGKKKKKENSNANKRKASDPTWFRAPEEKNLNVYVQGLPPDIHLEEFASIMSKCGIIMTDLRSGKPKLKLYKDDQGNLKGDGLCCYLKKESLDMAIQLLDDTDVRGGYHIYVQKANFELKGTYDPSKKPKMLSRKDKEKFKKEQEKLLDWKLARKDNLKKSERVLIFKNMFHPKEFEVNAVLITEIRDDLRKECEKFGAVKKVIVFDRHPDGVCSVSFKDIDEASACLKAMDKRWFDKKQIEVTVWDGNTDYQIEETDREREERMKNWEKFLVSDEDNDNKDTEGSAQSAND